MPESSWLNPVSPRRCKRKRRYFSSTQAEVFASRASARTGELILAYECPECGKFHIGHADRAQLIVRGDRCAPACQQCGESIPLARREKATANTSDIVYCSDDCKRLARRQRRKSRFSAFPQWTGPDVE